MLMAVMKGLRYPTGLAMEDVEEDGLTGHDLMPETNSLPARLVPGDGHSPRCVAPQKMGCQEETSGASWVSGLPPKWELKGPLCHKDIET